MNNFDEMCRLLERGGLQFRFNIIYAGQQISLGRGYILTTCV